MKALRWGDDDRYFGPFTWAHSASYPHWAVVLRSRGDDDDSNPGRCSLRFSFGKSTLIVALPAIVRPWREKRRANWDAETIQRLGRDWYWNTYPRQYGFSYSDGFLSIYYGRETHDSTTEQRWGYFLPWTQWRHVRHSLYGIDGAHFWTKPEQTKITVGDMSGWEAMRSAEESCPRASFEFEDYDGARLTVETRIEEREWHFGTGWFKWLSLFRRPKVRRYLDLTFSGETGPEKGSWKGGTIGTSIEMLPGELHESAFRRYCEQEHRAKGRRYKIKFIGAV